MLVEATGTKIDPPKWTPFVKEQEIPSPNGKLTLLKRDFDMRDYLVLTTVQAEGLTRRIYIPLDPDKDTESATPMLSETLSGRRRVISALGNADFLYVADEETDTGIPVRTVRTQPHLLSEDDSTLDGIPDWNTRLDVPTDTIEQWKKS